MFNGWALNGATLNGSGLSFRLIAAAVTISASSGVLAEAVADRPGAAGLRAGAAVTATAAQAHAATSRLPAVGGLSVDRPQDLLKARIPAHADAAADPYAVRAGAAQLDCRARVVLQPTYYQFFASLPVEGGMHAEPTRYALPRLSLDVGAAFSAHANKWHDTAIDAAVLAGMGAEAFVYFGGIQVLPGGARLAAEALVNGIHSVYVTLPVASDMVADQTRLAGSHAVCAVMAHAQCEAEPGRGALSFGRVVAGLRADWYNYTTAGSIGGAAASGLAEAVVEAAASSRLPVRAGGVAQWGLIIEPEGLTMAARAQGAAIAWNTVPAPVASGQAWGALAAEGWRVAFQSVALAGVASWRARPSVNLTNDAPEWRTLRVARSGRAMRVPEQSRTMRARP